MAASTASVVVVDDGSTVLGQFRSFVQRNLLTKDGASTTLGSVVTKPVVRIGEDEIALREIAKDMFEPIVSPPVAVDVGDGCAVETFTGVDGVKYGSCF